MYLYTIKKAIQKSIAMTIANENDIKVSNGKYFIYRRRQGRFFPIGKVLAEQMLCDGEAQYYKPYQF